MYIRPRQNFIYPPNINIDIEFYRVNVFVKFIRYVRPSHFRVVLAGREIIAENSFQFRKQAFFAFLFFEANMRKTIFYDLLILF